MTAPRSAALALALGLLPGCDGGGDTDAGPPDTGVRPAIVFTVDSIELQDAVVARSGGSILPNFGDQFYVATVTLEAVSEDGLPEPACAS